MTRSAPILEFDPDRSAILMPDPYRIGVGKPVPSRGVLCFFQDVIDTLLENGELVRLGDLGSERGKQPVYSTPGLVRHWQPVSWMN
jgi:hypothetical protein